MKALIFDSGPLITLAMTSTIHLLKKLKEDSDVRFFITREVEKECIIKPMNIKKYKLGALRIKELLDSEVLEMPEKTLANPHEMERLTKKIMNSANYTFYRGKRNLSIIDLGEATCLALSSIINQKNISNVIVIDERTTRMLCEKPENLRELLEKKLHTKIDMKSSADEFKKFKFIRSSEIILLAYKRGLIKNDDREMLDALLYGVKFRGCAISDGEISDLKKIA
jgi:hypothetical protein